MAEPVRITMPVPFDVGTVNAWLFPGSDPAIIDCGIKTEASWGLLHAALGNVDLRSLRVFITHGHVDHAGNAAKLARQGARVHAFDAEAPFISTFRSRSTERNDEFAAAALDHGTPDDEVIRMRESADRIDTLLDDVAIEERLTDGQRIVLGEQEAQVLLTPGHTEGSTCFALTEDNALVTGDTLLETITSNSVELRHADRGRFHQYLATLRGMRRFVGVNCLPGHRDPFVLTDAILDRHEERHERRRSRMLGLLESPQTGYQLTRQMFPHLSDEGDRFMALAEVVGHLHAAEIDGLVARDDSGRYRLR